MERNTGSSAIPEVIRMRIERYKPNAVSPAGWEVIRPFVTETLYAAKPQGRSAFEQDARMLSGIAAWSLDNGVPLEVNRVLDPDNVERYVSQGLRHVPSRATYRSVLRRLGRQLTTTAPWEPRPEPIPRRKTAVPYTEQEMRLLEQDARRQPTAAKRATALGFIALGAGAGLDGRRIADVRGTDIRTVGQIVLVDVNEPRARSVPVLDRYEDVALELAGRAGDRFVLHDSTPHRNRVNKLASGLSHGPRHPRLEPRRLRSTWIVEHLRRGTRLPELLRAAGNTRIETFDDLLAFVAPLDELTALKVLRGE